LASFKFKQSGNWTGLRCSTYLQRG